MLSKIFYLSDVTQQLNQHNQKLKVTISKPNFEKLTDQNQKFKK